jgi:hypothetical protein
MRRWVLLLLIPLIAAVCVVALGIGDGDEPAGERAAREDARARLDAFAPPPGAEAVDSTGTEIDGFGPEFDENETLIDVSGLWVSPEPLGTVMHWLRAAAPAGSRLVETGGSGRGVRASHEPGAAYDFGYWWGDARGIARERKLEVTVTRRGDGTAIRADAEGNWVVPRPSSERLPDGIRVIAIERERLVGRYEPRATGIVARGLIRSPEAVASIVALLDSLETVQPGRITCPPEAPHSVIRLRLLRQIGGRPLATTRMDWPLGPCKSLALTVEGRPQPSLAEGWLLHRRLGAALRGLTAP